MEKQLDLLQGTLDMLILKAISLSPLHGYGILLRIQQISKERLEIQQGSLVSRALPARTSRLDCQRMGRVREQATCSLLPAHRSWETPAAIRSRTLESDDRCHRRNSPDDTGGAMNFWARIRSWTVSHAAAQPHGT